MGAFERRRKSPRADARMRKGELISNIPSSLLPLNKAGQVSKNEAENLINSHFKRPQHGRQKSTINRYTELSSLGKR